jgi:hypothetical protein
MAFSLAEKTQIKRHLGYHAVAQSRYPLVEGFYALEDILATVPLETETEGRVLLERCNAIESDMAGVRTGKRLQASKVGEITLNRDELRQLEGELSRNRRELAMLLGIPYRRGANALMVV